MLLGHKEQRGLKACRAYRGRREMMGRRAIKESKVVREP